MAAPYAIHPWEKTNPGFKSIKIFGSVILFRRNITPGELVGLGIMVFKCSLILLFVNTL